MSRRRTPAQDHLMIRAYHFIARHPEALDVQHEGSWIEAPYADMQIGQMREDEFLSVGTRADIAGWLVIIGAPAGTVIRYRGAAGQLLSPCLGTVVQEAASLLAGLTYDQTHWLFNRMDARSVLTGIRHIMASPDAGIDDLDGCLTDPPPIEEICKMQGFIEEAGMLIALLQRPDLTDALRYITSRPVAGPYSVGLNPEEVSKAFQALYDIGVSEPGPISADRVREMALAVGVSLERAESHAGPWPRVPWSALVYENGSRVFVALGGSGTNQAIPTCPVCRCYGGGGHGGGCPNASLPAGEWRTT